ncbi:hypothetical protein BV898_15424 [Hypsibius exemplaris]|uniref:ABC transporter domain-containing protein n=1 Tax=Hypsibius exemplaris TaxID=2072580 RepID=A0A9X6NCY4_HYPEX|nr:hypothetical protein BV898_15424 [Hypsibius exemplaris]
MEIAAAAARKAEVDRQAEEHEAERNRIRSKRQAQVDLVNGLQLAVRQNDKLLLVGPKGTGKSTFMWLLNQSEKPKPSNSDGTVEILQLQNYVDSIGLTGWNIDELVKLLALLIYDGIHGI